MISNCITYIEDYLIGVNSIPNQLRNNHYFDKKSYNELISVLHKVITYYENKNEVPKRLALCFVDISNSFYANGNYFSEKELEEIEDAAIEISRLANILFS